MADFDTVLIKDSRIADVTDRITYGVKSGAASNTYQRFNAVSNTPNSIVHNIQVPSESVLVSREILLESVMTFNIKISVIARAGAAAGNLDTDFEYGRHFALKSFPFNSLINTAQANINNTSVSINLSDVKNVFLKLMNKCELQKYFGLCPTLTDETFDYLFNSSTTNNSVFGTYLESTLNCIVGNSSHPVTVAVGAVTGTGNSFNGDQMRRTQTAVAGEFNFTVTVTTVEPLMLSPFIFGGDSAYNKQAFAGINGLNFVFNLDANCTNAVAVLPLDSAASGFGFSSASVQLTNITQQILFNFLSTQPTDLINPKNVVPYIDYPRYTFNQYANVAASSKATLVSQTIQLNQLPDYFIVCVRDRTRSVLKPERYLSIESISVNLNNTSGLLSSASQYDLWKISVDNGSNQSWYEFSGLVNSYASANNFGIGSLLTSGSILILDPAVNLSLPNYLSSGSIGQYTFQITLNVNNRSASAFEPEVLIITPNSGLFVTVAGSSQISTGILTKQLVMDTNQQQAAAPLSKVLYDRLVGGQMSNRIASAMQKMVGPRYSQTKGPGPRMTKPSGGLDKFC
jgi:hypothetical protein